ncbi:MAG TPA: hypothetical protein PKU80_10860 [Candidatus Limiplasma sp.]|nr:hypothetical protein [Candidatus Limiplasma sp.]HRX08383.1 hypothetical protein [Candidatus Limiplasma sp.]
MASGFWQRLSDAYGLQYEDKRLYGRVDGYFITLSSMMGTLFRLQVYLPGLNQTQSTQMPEALQKAALLRAEAIRMIEEALRTYKLAKVRTENGNQYIAVEFRRTGRAVKYIGELIKTVSAGLAGLGFATSMVCGHCRQAIESGEVPVRVGHDVYPMHDNCAQAVERESDSQPETKNGSLIAGVAGALLAAIVASIPWAVILAAGYMASIVGLLIGFVVSKGYDLLHGRQGRAKIIIVILCVLLSVALGQLLGTSYSIAQAYDETQAGLKENEYMIMTKSEFILWSWPNLIWTDADARGEVLKNFGVGVFFALLGCYSMLLSLLRNSVSTRPKRLPSLR